MAASNIEIPSDLLSDISGVAEQLGITENQTVQLALHAFLESNLLANAIEGIARIQENTELVNFPELEEFGLESIKFHPKAMEELEVLDEDVQIAVLEDIITRVSDENEEEVLDWVIKEDPKYQVVISGFSFGDVVYQIGDEVIIHHIAIDAENLSDEDDEDEDDDNEEMEEDETEFNHEEEKF